MSFLRNREVRQTLLLLLALTAAECGAAFLWNRKFGVFTLCFALLFLAVWLISTFRRYRRIEELAMDIDRLLHGEEPDIPPDRYNEGELGILQSEIHKMTARLKNQRSLLEQDKVYLSDLIADISHQIRTPLTSINLLVSLLSEENLTDGRRTELLRELTALLSRIDWLITALLKLSRLDAGSVTLKRQSAPLNALIERACAPLAVSMELRGQQLTVNASGRFTGDLDWTAEALGNILKNCMEHTPQGGTIEIAATETALYAEIVISDTGPGFDREDLPHIFERFYKGKQASETGFGIGLALTKAIVTAQNGTVKAENRLPHGARFTVRFYKSTV